MSYLMEKIRNLRHKEKIDETTQLSRYLDNDAFSIDCSQGQFDVRISGMWTAAVAFRKLVLEKGKLEEIYDSFFRRNEKRFTFPMGVCYGPSGNGAGIEFDLEANRTANPGEVYFKMHNVGGFSHSLVGKINKLPKEKIEKISYCYAAALTSGKLLEE